MTEIAFTTSLIACGLIVAGCFIGVARDVLREQRARREYRERWIKLLSK